mmetsp:Transcript_138476/g.244598  ORF Transcript_138476/g.244598 Transcript_138476/m.244598 type:complete len:635 (+) Transcript_138476:75-1979(+)
MARLLCGSLVLASVVVSAGKEVYREHFWAECKAKETGAGDPPEWFKIAENKYGGECEKLEQDGVFGPLFVPVTEANSWAHVFTQAGLYGYILFLAAGEIGDGADMLLLSPKFGPLVGSILVPILGAVPDGLMVLFSGLNPETAQEQIKVGVGALAGSTVMLLTLPWFLTVLTGRVNIKNGECTYKRPADGGDDWAKDMPPGSFSLWTQGVAMHDSIKKGAKLMILLSSSYYVMQIPAFIAEAEYKDSLRKQTKFEYIFAIIGLCMSGFGFIYYLYLMWADSQDEKSDVKQQVVEKNVEMIEKGHLTLRGAMHDFRVDTNSQSGQGLGENLLGADKGDIVKSPSEEAVRHMCQVLVPFFRKYDLNGDNQISIEEFRMIMNDLGESNIPAEKQQCIFQAADMDGSGSISFEEFVACIMAFAIGMPEKPAEPANKTQRSAAAYVTQEKETSAEDDDEEDEEETMPEDLADLSPEEQQRRLKNRAFGKLTVGSILVLLFSDPMCDLLDVVGNKLDINSFYIGFMIAPLASNASELMSSMQQAQKKTMNSAKNALSTLEGAACMNNTFCLFFFFLLIIIQGIAWQFAAETISIVGVQLIIGALALTCPTHNVFTGIIILMLYPGAMATVYILENYLGLD